MPNIHRAILFSVVIPVTEESAYLLPFTLSSLEEQEEGSFQVILVDGTKSGVNLGSNPRYQIEIIRVAKSNRFALMNEGILRATGEYIHFLMPGEFYISCFVFPYVSKRLFEHSLPDLAYGGCLIRHSFGQPSVFLKKITSEDLRGVRVPPSLQAFWFRKETLHLIGMFNEKFEVEGGMELVYRFFAAETLSKVCMPRILTDYEYRKLSSKRLRLQFLEMLRIVLFYSGVSWSLFKWGWENHVRLVRWGWKMVKTAFWKPQSLCFFLLFTSLFASSPDVPPAGVVERQLEYEYYEEKQVDPEKMIPLMEVDVPEKQLDLGEETAFVKEVRFTGNTIFSPKQFQEWVAPYMNRDLSMREMTEICQLIQEKYGEKGYFLSRAYLPAQEIHDGVLEIAILEGKLGEISVIGNKYYREKFILDHFADLQNKAINYDQFLKALLLLDENIDLNIGAIFKKGKEYGTADVVLRVKDDRPIHVTLDHNNYGSDHTSKQRTGLRVDFGNTLMDGDVLTLIEVVGSPISILDFTDAVYRFPVNVFGGNLEIAYLLANFKTGTIGTGEDAIKFEGRSHIATLKYLQALQRTRKLNTDCFTSFDYKQIQNFSAGARSSFDKLRVLSGGVSADYIDSWQGRNLFSAYFGWGIPDILGGLDAEDSEGSRQDGGGRFVRLNGSYKRVQYIKMDAWDRALGDWFLILNAVGQGTWDKLPLPEQIYIGGIDTVRGYKLAEGLGDNGFYTNVELRVPIPFLHHRAVPWSKKSWGEFFQFVAFFDHGQTFTVGADNLYQNKVVGDSVQRGTVQQPGRAILTSVGFGARLNGPWKLEFSFDAGYPLTERHRSSSTITYYRVAWKIV